MFRTWRGTPYSLPGRLNEPTEPVVHEGEGQLAPGMMAKSTTPTVSPRPAHLPLPYHVEEGELSLLALTSMTFPHPEAVGVDVPKRAYSKVVRTGLIESQASGAVDTPGAPAVGGVSTPEQASLTHKTPTGTGEPSTTEGNGIGNDDPGYGCDPVPPRDGPSHESMMDAPGAHAKDPWSTPAMQTHMADVDPHSPPTPGKTTEELADILGSYPTRDHVDRPAPTPPQAEPTASIVLDSELEGRPHLEGMKGSLSSRTPSPTQEEFITARGRWSVSQSRTVGDNVPTASINTKSKFFPHNSLAIEHMTDEATAPEHPDISKLRFTLEGFQSPQSPQSGWTYSGRHNLKSLLNASRASRVGPPFQSEMQFADGA
ncbi:hypothetical protein FRC11_000632 [Ceratobasidium sp. 423]|nr:hypothetical protein FRC11_000632 [Ceratobasidium sp. 423]